MNSKAKNRLTVNRRTLIVTVDIGKVKNTGYYRFDGVDIKPFEFFNSGQGFKKFWECISFAMKRNDVEQTIVGLESTGSYGEPLIHFLKDKPVHLVQVNPMHTKRLKELRGNSPNKTDNKDPKVIADIIELGNWLSVIIPEGVTAELRRLTHARESHIVGRNSLMNQVHDNVVLVFPEFLQVMKGIKSKTARCLLNCLPTPQLIVSYGLDRLTGLMKTVSRGKHGRDRAIALYEAAKSSIGIKEGVDSILLGMSQKLRLVEMLDNFIAEIEEKMSDYLKEIPYSRCILSIKGIGEITTAGLIGEVGDFNKFKTIQEVHKLAGLNLYEKSSGKHQGGRHISKRGRALMRKLLFFAAINTVRKDRIMHEYYQRCLQRGMKKIAALTAVARKLLGIIFSLVRNHSEFVHNYTRSSRLLKKAA